MSTQVAIPQINEVIASIDTKKAEAVNICQYWPKAKSFLQILPTVVKNPFVKAAVPILIAAGDKLCPGS